MVWECFEENGDDVLRIPLYFKVVERRGHGRPKMTWRGEVEELTKQNGLQNKDAADKIKWRNAMH